MRRGRDTHPRRKFRRGGALVLGLALALALLAHGSRALGANDPRLLWKSLETEHFRITYYSTEDEVAEHLGALAEGIYQRLSPAVGWTPSEKTEVLLTDQTDGANGSATALPYNAVRLNVTAPDDMSPLGDVDDWYLELLTHEYTHILHTDHITGIPALVNRLMGKTFAPNQLQPHWLLEGLAVFEESERTTGGRLRSSMWNMFMRADVLERNVATLDVFSNIPRRWPGGNIWYLYGSFFMKWIAETYGEQAIRAMIDDYSRQIIPFAINRSIRRATGHTYEELYRAWVSSMERAFGAQAESVRARGLREGLRLTHTGYTYEHPRWIPRTSWPDHAGDLAYYVDDAHTVPGIWALPLERTADGSVVGSREDRRELVIRTNGVAALSFLPDGTAVFNSLDIHNNLFAFDDLFELRASIKAPSGLEESRTRWSNGWRAIAPSVSPDGQRVVFTTNHRGTTRLMIADIVASPQGEGRHALANVRPLVPSARFDQAFTPRWSPDNRHVAYSSWTRGGYRDVRIVDTWDGSWVELTHDRAVDGDPVYSADGRRLFFHSDRSGISNVYAYDLGSSELRQVTNVINGAYQPEPSPDGKWLAYVGYTHEGFDLFVIPLDESGWLTPLPYEETRAAPLPEPVPVRALRTPYNPWLTLQPRAYSVRITTGNFGQASLVSVSGSDIAGLHSFAGNIFTEWEHPEFQGVIAYGYHRLPFDVGISAYRQIAPTQYQLGTNFIPGVQESTGASVSIGYAMPRAFDGQSFSLTYSLARVAGQVTFPQLNPYDTPSVPTPGLLGTLQLGWSYSYAWGSTYGVGQEQGFTVSTNLEIADQALASDFSGYAAYFGFASYHKMPWLRHHTLALGMSGGMSGGNRAGRGPYYIAGYVEDIPLIDVIQNYIFDGGFKLRGYPAPYAEAGSYYALFNAEYRFPIAVIDRGPSTLPIFLNRVTGAAFVDYGSAFDTASTAEFKTGAGAELWFDVTLGYILGFTFRLGYAKGLASHGIDKTYFVAAVPF
jgi:hypothetical protein